MTYRVKVEGPSVTNPFGVDILEVAGPASVQDIDGVLVITTKPYPGRPGLALGEDPKRPSVSYPARRPTRGSVVCYPRGGWTKVTVTDFAGDSDED